jgi:hypothetical protein
MAGIPLLINGRTELHAAVWADAARVPTIFIAVSQDGSTGLMHPERVADLLEQIRQGDMDEDDAWMHLLIKTPAMDYPQPCGVFVSTVDDKTPIHFKVNGQVVYRMAH